MPVFAEGFRRRPYRHFDHALSPEGAEAIATNPARVAGHGFYPFLRRVLVVPRYRPNEHKVVAKERPVGYAAHSDAAVYGWYGALLQERYEADLVAQQLAHVPMAYRRFDPPECNIHFALRAFQFIASHRPCVVLAFDIKSFFDTLNHRLLLDTWRRVLGTDELPQDHYRVYRSLTHWSWVEEQTAYEALGQKRRRCGQPTRLCSGEQFRALIRGGGLIRTNPQQHGIPQGSPMSGVLSNVYMLPFDARLRDFVARCGGFVQRYCDDILVVVPVEEQAAAIEAVTDAVRERRLAVQDDKTDIVTFPAVEANLRIGKPVQYLGLTFDGDRVLVRSQTLSRYHRRLREYLRLAGNRAAVNPARPAIYRRTLHRRFSHRGRRNFIAYGRRCAEITGSDGPRRQIGKHWRRISLWAEEFTSPRGRRA